MHKRKDHSRTTARPQPGKDVAKKFKFVYIDPASMTHAFFLYEMPEPGDVIEAYGADGKRLVGKMTLRDVKVENIVPLK